MAADDERIVIAGSGVAGLAAAYRLQGSGSPPFTIFERAPEVGGYSRTLRHGEFRFDLGGHRFYTKKAHIQKLIEDLIGEDLLTVDRVSRILFRGKFFDYPLGVFNTLKALGMTGAARAVLDYGGMKVSGLFGRRGPEDTFEQWALNRFGQYLYRAFFEVYTEKTWGIPCTELSADFAEQRIKGLSFREAVKDAVLRKGEDGSLVRRFAYPRYGFGQIPDKMAKVVEQPNTIETATSVVALEHDADRITAVIVSGAEGTERRVPCSELISSIAIDDMVRMMRPASPERVTEAADRLRYRGLTILFLVLDVEQVSPDHWTYVPSPDIGFCRMHEPKNWSPEMAPPGKTGVVLEYFCQEADTRWQRDDWELSVEAGRDLERMGLVDPATIVDSVVVRLSRAYPLYGLGYNDHLDVVAGYLNGFTNLHRIGRNATFLYTSSDHYMDMGLKAAENVLGHDHDLAAIGREKSYAESWKEGER